MRFSPEQLPERASLFIQEDTSVVNHVAGFVYERRRLLLVWLQIMNETNWKRISKAICGNVFG